MDKTCITLNPSPIGLRRRHFPELALALSLLPQYRPSDPSEQQVFFLHSHYHR